LVGAGAQSHRRKIDNCAGSKKLAVGGEERVASRKKSGFLSDYSVEGAYLLKPARAAGRAGIVRATDKQSRSLLAKIWPRAKGVDDTDLEEIWRSEIRQLQHLAAVPQADELLVNMITSGKDADGFYLVLEAGQGAPLESFLLATKKPNLFSQARQPRYRRLLWANARRLAQALGVWSRDEVTRVDPED
jgi:hypothetical protein